MGKKVALDIQFKKNKEYKRLSIESLKDILLAKHDFLLNNVIIHYETVPRLKIANDSSNSVISEEMAINIQHLYCMDC